MNPTIKIIFPSVKVCTVPETPNCRLARSPIFSELTKLRFEEKRRMRAADTSDILRPKPNTENKKQLVI